MGPEATVVEAPAATKAVAGAGERHERHDHPGERPGRSQSPVRRGDAIEARDERGGVPEA